jgi:hypothetical protein
MSTPYDEPLDEDAIDEMLWHLKRVDAQHHEQYRRLLNVEGHMERLIRDNDPAVFGAWLRDYDCTAKRDKSVHHLRFLIERDLLCYMAWFKRLHDAYVQAPPRSLFKEPLAGEDASPPGRAP